MTYEDYKKERIFLDKTIKENKELLKNLNQKFIEKTFNIKIGEYICLDFPERSEEYICTFAGVSEIKMHEEQATLIFKPNELSKAELYSCPNEYFQTYITLPINGRTYNGEGIRPFKK
jgi:hypothetical protein